MNILKPLIAILVIVIAVLLTFYVFTDQICKKPFSNEFKQTQEYKDMKCNQ